MFPSLLTFSLSADQTLCPVPLSFPKVIPEHFESLMTLFSIIHPLFQLVEIDPDLFSRRSSPLGCRLADIKTADSYKIYAWLVGIKACSSG